MKKITLILSFLVFSYAAKAQIADGSVAPDFTATDIDGNVHTLSEYLAAGKTVIMDISATWCGPCWNYHNTHALDDLMRAYGPEASGEVVVLFVEGDGATTLADLYGTGSNTRGDWVANSEYAIIDSATIANLYEIEFFPTVFRICPDGFVSEVGSLSAAGLRNSINNNCGLPAMAGEQNFVRMLENETGSCTTLSSPVAKMKNYGTNSVTAATINLKENGTTVATKLYSGTAAQFSTKTITFDPVSINPSSTYTVEVSDVNTVPNANEAFSSADMSLYVASQTTTSVVVKVYTDNYPSEIKWRIKNSAGTVVANGGPYEGPANGGGDDANTTKIHDVTLPAGECFTVDLQDTYGDGWSYGDTPHGLEIFTDEDTSILNIPAGDFGTLLSKPSILTTTVLGVEDIADKKLGLYPNPSTGIIQISTQSPVAVSIVDVTGKVVFNASNVTSQTAMDLSGLQKGIYIAKIIGENASTTEKIILK